MLATIVGDHPREWEHHLSKLCMACNTSVHSSTGFTPFYLMFGRQAKLPIDIVYGNLFPESLSIGQYVTDLRKSFQEAYQNVRARTNAVTVRLMETCVKLGTWCGSITLQCPKATTLPLDWPIHSGQAPLRCSVPNSGQSTKETSFENSGPL